MLIYAALILDGIDSFRGYESQPRARSYASVDGQKVYLPMCKCSFGDRSLTGCSSSSTALWKGLHVPFLLWQLAGETRIRVICSCWRFRRSIETGEIAKMSALLFCMMARLGHWSSTSCDPGLGVSPRQEDSIGDGDVVFRDADYLSGHVALRLAKAVWHSSESFIAYS